MTETRLVLKLSIFSHPVEGNWNHSIVSTGFSFLKNASPQNIFSTYFIWLESSLSFFILSTRDPLNRCFGQKRSYPDKFLGNRKTPFSSSLFCWRQLHSLSLYTHTFICTYHRHYHCICPPQCSYHVTHTTPCTSLTQHTWRYTTHCHAHEHTHTHTTALTTAASQPFHTYTQPFSLHVSSQPALHLWDFKDKCGSVMSME